MNDETRSAMTERLLSLERQLLDRAFLYDSPTVYREAIRDVCRELRLELIQATAAA